jgi:lysophospholipase L1-like esterase
MKTVITLLLFVCALPGAEATHWVATWAASPSIQNPDPVAMRTRKLEFVNQTVREIVHTSIGGDTVRIKLSNVFGTDPVKVTASHIALSATAGAITAGSDRALTFSGKPAVTILPGALVLSDPVKLDVPVLGDLAVSLFFADTTMTTTLHYSAQQNSYVAAGDVTSEVRLTDPQMVTSWSFLTAVDVLAPASTGLIVAYGDSITDGAKSAMDVNHRWPNVLANRLITVKGPNRFAVVDAGIGGNKIISDATGRNIAYGVNGLARLERDALAQAGVKYLLLLEGINDLSSNASVDDLVAGMKQIIERCHENGIRVIGGTITPAERAGARANGLSDRETRRLALNEWIRNGKSFDGYVDFEKAVEDPAQPGSMKAEYDSGDHLHPNDAGYKAMGEAVDVSLFQ